MRWVSKGWGRMDKLRKDAKAIWESGTRAVDPRLLVKGAVRVKAGRLILGDQAFRLDDIGRIVVVGAGKAGRPMAEAVEASLGRDLMKAKQLWGCVNVLNEHAGRLSHIVLHPGRSAAWPYPTTKGVQGTKKMLRVISSLGPRDLVICLLSGGGSALMPAPVEDVSLEAKKDVTKLLSKAGADIFMLNTVRKHISQVKGGQLAQACKAGRMVSLIISDVVGDRLDTIASGPTVPDKTTFEDALEVFRGLGVAARVPRQVMDHIKAGANGRIPGTPKRLPPGIMNLVIGSNAVALTAAEARARQLGYRVLSLGSRVEGESREVGIFLASLALSIKHDSKPFRPPACVLCGGETTVSNVAARGKGGRNQELVLAAMDHLRHWGMDGMLITSAGTDGEDGPTDAAGAFADERVLRSVARLGLDMRAYLARNRSYHFFKEAGGHITTGPTGTNVMDLCVILIT